MQVASTIPSRSVSSVELASIFDHRHVDARVDELIFDHVHANADAADACYGQLIFDHIDLHVMGCPVGGNPPPLPAAVWLLYLQDLSTYPGMMPHRVLDGWAAANQCDFHSDSWMRQSGVIPLRMDCP